MAFAAQVANNGGRYRVYSVAVGLADQTRQHCVKVKNSFPQRVRICIIVGHFVLGDTKALPSNERAEMRHHEDAWLLLDSPHSARFNGTILRALSSGAPITLMRIFRYGKDQTVCGQES